MLLDDENNALVRQLNSSLSSGGALSFSTRCSWKPTGPVAAPCERGPPHVGRSLIAISGVAARAFSSPVVIHAGEGHSSPSAHERLSGAGSAEVARTTRNHNERSVRRLEKVAFRRENSATETESNGNWLDLLAVSPDYDNFDMVTRFVCAVLYIIFRAVTLRS